MSKIGAENTTFSTIESFKHQDSPLAKYKLLVIDECSTVSNKDMVEVLQKQILKCFYLSEILIRLMPFNLVTGSLC